MAQTHFKLHYHGFLFLFIFWVIVFFPIALVLLVTSSTFKVNQTTYKLEYAGSKYWLCFWILVFFPIAFLLLFLNGFSARAESA